MVETASPVLVFAHYFGGSARSWRPLMAEPGVAGETPDLAGFGGAAVPAGRLGLETYVDQLESLAAGRSWVAVGHSMGGKIALAAAARRARALKGLILIAPSPPTPEPMKDEDRQKAIDGFGDRTAAQATVHKITDNSLAPGVFETCVADQLRADRAAWLWWLEDGSRDDISRRTAGLEIPTLIIAGDHDTVLGLSTPFQVATGLRGAEIQVVARGGHLVPLEQPAAVAALIRDFLAELPGQRG